MNRYQSRFVQALLGLCFCLLPPSPLAAQDREEAGQPIGKISVVNNLILLELDEGALGHEHLFDQKHRTIRFTPERAGYRVEDLPLHWDAEFGQKITDPKVSLHN